MGKKEAVVAGLETGKSLDQSNVGPGDLEKGFCGGKMNTTLGY